jgi:hypothetical protein
MILLVTDLVYPKTSRFIDKVRTLVGPSDQIVVAVAEGFPGVSVELPAKHNAVPVIKGPISCITEQVKAFRCSEIQVVALNQSALLPAMAISNLLGLPIRGGIIEACDKRRTRELLGQFDDLALEWCEVLSGAQNLCTGRYVIKPAFGTSSRDVRLCRSWEEVIHFGTAPDAKRWLPQEIIDALPYTLGRSDAQVAEAYVDGTEFSIDGWIRDDQFVAIVQHKLFMRSGAFFGDGVTISPPVPPQLLSSVYGEFRNGKETITYQGLRNGEAEITAFGRKVLHAINFTRGVFHIEGREQRGEANLHVIEVNPRAPGGSLWKSALIRTGYDLELVDAAIQLGKPVIPRADRRAKYVLHYPFYAREAGILSDWGDLDANEFPGLPNLTVDCVAKLGQCFAEDDFHEEAYLAFAVTHDETLEGLLSQSHRILQLAPPTIRAD